MMCCSDKELFDKIFLLGCHRSHPPATTALLAVGIGVETFDITIVGNGDDHVFFSDQIFITELAIIFGNDSAAMIAILLLDLLQFIFDNIEDEFFIIENLSKISDSLNQLFIFSIELFPFHPLQSTQSHLQDSLCLQFGEVKLLHQFFFSITMRSANGGNDLINKIKSYS